MFEKYFVMFEKYFGIGIRKNIYTMVFISAHLILSKMFLYKVLSNYTAIYNTNMAIYPLYAIYS